MNESLAEFSGDGMPGNGKWGELSNVPTLAVSLTDFEGIEEIMRLCVTIFGIGE